MNHLPINPLSPEEQQKIMGQMYLIMDKQVQSYHKHYHMGSNSSVPVELAQELMESVAYTLNLAGGIYARGSVGETFRFGQEVLEERLGKAKSMLDLVTSTAPQWQTECRWAALRYLRHYLEQYDHLHLAHKGPEDLFYPILISPPEGIQGIDSCLFYLKILWIENQIMAGVPEDALEPLWDRLPPETLNQCEQVLINGIGKAILGTGIDPLVFAPEEHFRIMYALMNIHKEQLLDAAQLLCKWLDLKDDDARMYVNAVIPLILPWTDGSITGANAENLFL